MHHSSDLRADVSRKGAEKAFRNAAALCAFAPLREKKFSPECKAWSTKKHKNDKKYK
jgi:hypothetical protein